MYNKWPQRDFFRILKKGVLSDWFINKKILYLKGSRPVKPCVRRVEDKWSPDETEVDIY